MKQRSVPCCSERTIPSTSTFHCVGPKSASPCSCRSGPQRARVRKQGLVKSPSPSTEMPRRNWSRNVSSSSCSTLPCPWRGTHWPMARRSSMDPCAACPRRIALPSWSSTTRWIVGGSCCPPPRRSSRAHTKRSAAGALPACPMSRPPSIARRSSCAARRTLWWSSSRTGSQRLASPQTSSPPHRQPRTLPTPRSLSPS